MFGDEDGAVGPPRVKICGLTTLEDAVAAIEFGADALGFNFFAGSKRYLAMADRGWIAALPAKIPKVAVLVNPRWEEAVAVAKSPGITALQLHGAETPDFCRQLAEHGIRFAKALPMSSPDSITNLPSFSTRTVLLDSSTRESLAEAARPFRGKSPVCFVKANPHLRVVLAGGLTPENVADAVAAVQPFAVDVTSGVESFAGRKDYGRLRAFIEAARGQ